MQMDDFYEHISRNSTHGIPYPEAVQLLLWTFLTVGHIPKQFQKLRLSKVNLAILFSKLSMNGKIIIDPADNVSVADISRPEHWENLVEASLQRKITLDETFLSRISHYL
jgi:hypothetical protein